MKKKQKNYGFIPDNLFINVYNNGIIPCLPNHLFFQHKDIFISKHSRFAPYPEHTHQFLEINYIFKGKCKQNINGTPYLLKEGDILIMDSDTTHSIETMEKDDIMINILFQNKDISLDWLNHLQAQNSILYSFFLSTTSKHLNKKNYILYSTPPGSPARNTILKIVEEYFEPYEFSNELIKCYLPILFYELARLLPKYDNDIQLYLKNSTFGNILRIIDKEYITITLHELSDRLNFNKNYLSNLIKKECNHTFTHLITQRKLIKAHLLIKTTTLPIQEIAILSGFSNKTYFYKHYKKAFGHNPLVDRKKSNQT